MQKFIWLGFSLFLLTPVFAQSDKDFYSIIEKVNARRIEKDIRTLANFGTRHTLSDTLANNRGIGAARRWILNPSKKFQKLWGLFGSELSKKLSKS